MASGAPSTLQRILETRLTQLAGELQYAFEAELAARLAAEVEKQIGESIRRAAAEVVPQARAVLAETLNQWVRRLRQAGGLDAMVPVLLDGAGPFATGAAVFRIDGETARAAGGRGFPGAATEAFGALELPLAAAPAFAAAVDTGDPVMAIAGPGEIPAALRELAGIGEQEKVAVFPLSLRDRAHAVLLVWGDAQPAALELLAQVASAVWTAQEPAPAPPGPELVPVAPAAPAPAPAARSWDILSKEDQQLHLRAQRAARVAVAEIRLYRATAVQAGRQRGDLYAALRDPIDRAREAFQRDFMSVSPSMVDYLHLELLRTLANDDAAFLGSDYPGPLV